MPDLKENATTMWQDMHGEKRGHQLMIEKVADAIPGLGATENAANYDHVLAHAKLFSPYSNWTWYITEMDRETGQCFGLVDGLERELGYFDLTELAETTVYGGVPAVERDLYWEPKTLGEIKNGSREDSQHGEEAAGEAIMTDETGTENRSPEAPSAEEFLFGQPAGDAIADEIPLGEDGGEAAADVAYEDANIETAEEPDVADDSEKTAASPDDLKVVLSIRAGRATIGVQQPSSDAHIESFDDSDLIGLADEFPAVVARARARWEEEPMHPAYERPALPARRQNRRRQGTPSPADTEAGEAEQPQAETLRLF